MMQREQQQQRQRTTAAHIVEQPASLLDNVVAASEVNRYVPILLARPLRATEQDIDLAHALDDLRTMRMKRYAAQHTGDRIRVLRSAQQLRRLQHAVTHASLVTFTCWQRRPAKRPRFEHAQFDDACRREIAADARFESSKTWLEVACSRFVDVSNLRGNDRERYICICMDACCFCGPFVRFPAC